MRQWKGVVLPHHSNREVILTEITPIHDEELIDSLVDGRYPAMNDCWGNEGNIGIE